MLTIAPVRTSTDLRAFLDLTDRLYSGNPAWIAPLRMELKQRLSRTKNSFFRKGEADYFLARRGRDVVGRITAQLNRAANPGEAPREANFGFYEAVDDAEVARGLYSAACEWARARRAQKLVGPYNFRLEDPAPGFLSKGFDLQPTFMMPYSQPYYLAQAESSGFSAAMELSSYTVTKDDPVLAEFMAHATAAGSIPDLQVRPFRMRRLYEEAEILRGIFNEALQDNWGYVPMTVAQARGMAKNLRFIADPRIVLIAEVRGRPIGAVINLPNYNDLLHDCGGRIFPKALFRMLLRRRNIRGIRGYALAIISEYQRRGISSALVGETFARAVAAGYMYSEVSWILGSNVGMNELSKAVGGKTTKQYRLVSRDL